MKRQHFMHMDFSKLEERVCAINRDSIEDDSMHMETTTIEQVFRDFHARVRAGVENMMFQQFGVPVEAVEGYFSPEPDDIILVKGVDYEEVGVRGHSRNAEVPACQG